MSAHTGLYAVMMAGLVYGLWGSSKHAAIGLASVPCLLVGSAVSGACRLPAYLCCVPFLRPCDLTKRLFADVDKTTGWGVSGIDGWCCPVVTLPPAELTDDIGERIQYMAAITFLVGVMSLLVGMFRLGFVLNFLSRPVLSGFMSAAACITGVSVSKVFPSLASPSPRRASFEGPCGKR